MEWYYYFSGFLSGAVLTNSVPHFVKGVSGDKFPTPFSKPHGKGLSSPLVNVVWALVNLLVGYLLFRLADISLQNNFMLIAFFAGVACLSIFSSIQFVGKDKE
jgi:hypothetical protein